MIAVWGLGFVGLTTALGFCKKGFPVYGIDSNPEKIEQLRRGIIPFHEPGLAEALDEELGDKFLINASVKDAVNNCKIFFICVGTPEKSDGHADLSFLLKALNDILLNAGDDLKTIVIKSSVPPSTITKEVQPFINKFKLANPVNVSIASNPEFLREGNAWDDFMNPDRIVVGFDDEWIKPILSEIYKDFGAPIHYVSFNTAEFIKYLSNTLLSTLISFSNEMSMVADHIGDINIPEAFKILHQDKRWFGQPAAMSSYVFPGCGYGGYCLPKDTAALKAISTRYGYLPKILQANLDVNEEIRSHLVNKIISEVDIDQTIGILGLSFKGGSDDVRLSPSYFIIQLLLSKGYQKIAAYDPIANKAFAEAYQLPISYCTTLEELYSTVDVLVLLTNWPVFKENEAKLKQKKIFDYRYALK